LKKGVELVELIYQVSSSFPDDERFGLISQIRRSAISITSNIAECSARKSTKELLHFISIALGSLSELETQYLIAVRLGFTSENSKIMDLLIDEKKLLLGYRNHVRKKSNFINTKHD
jgi:four helix bundle protein